MWEDDVDDENCWPGTPAEQEIAKMMASERAAEREAMARWPEEDRALEERRAREAFQRQAELDPVSEGRYITMMDSLEAEYDP